MREIAGACHCGGITFEFCFPDQGPDSRADSGSGGGAAIAVRECGCGFCRSHMLTPAESNGYGTLAPEEVLKWVYSNDSKGDGDGSLNECQPQSLSVVNGKVTVEL